jgi:hypothetical protein
MFVLCCPFSAEQAGYQVTSHVTDRYEPAMMYSVLRKKLRLIWDFGEGVSCLWSLGEGVSCPKLDSIVLIVNHDMIGFFYRDHDTIRYDRGSRLSYRVRSLPNQQPARPSLYASRMPAVMNLSE